MPFWPFDRGDDSCAENWFFWYPLEAIFANEIGALPKDVDGMEGVICHEDVKSGDIVPLKLSFAEAGYPVNEETEVRGEPC